MTILPSNTNNYLHRGTSIISYDWLCCYHLFGFCIHVCMYVAVMWVMNSSRYTFLLPFAWLTVCVPFLFVQMHRLHKIECLQCGAGKQRQWLMKTTLANARNNIKEMKKKKRKNDDDDTETLKNLKACVRNFIGHTADSKHARTQCGVVRYSFRL